MSHQLFALAAVVYNNYSVVRWAGTKQSPELQNVMNY